MMARRGWQYWCDEYQSGETHGHAAKWARYLDRTTTAPPAAAASGGAIIVAVINPSGYTID